EGVGGLAHLAAAGRSAQGKAIWVIQGANTTVANIEFSGAAVADHNGAGIRQEGAGLTVSGCYFHDNEDGILTGANPNSDITIASSEFAHNGYSNGLAHNMYIGHVRSFTLVAGFVHDAIVGHEVKSRADTNYILYNRIQDGDNSTASYDIDLPNGGASYIIGNVIRKGPRAQNNTVITSGEEGATNPVQAFSLINNTVVNDRSAGTFVRVLGAVSELRLPLRRAAPGPARQHRRAGQQPGGGGPGLRGRCPLRLPPEGRLRRHRRRQRSREQPGRRGPDSLLRVRGPGQPGLPPDGRRHR